MPTTQRKFVPRPARKTRGGEASVAPNSYAGRLRLAMQAKSMAIGAEYRQKDLMADIQRVVGRALDEPPLLTQQSLSKLMRGKAVESAHTPAIAAALGVSAMWLAYGRGPASIIEEMSRKLA